MKLLKWFAYLSVFGVLVAIALPNPHSGGDRPKSSSVKANMHTIQTTAETYAVDFGGVYPDSMEALAKEAVKRSYWKDFKNPFTGLTGADNAWMAKSPKTAIDPSTGTGAIVVSGAVIYDPVEVNGKVLKYYIYGGEKTANTVILDKGQAFYLTNQ
jgi:hypothetical protein